MRSAWGQAASGGATSRRRGGHTGCPPTDTSRDAPPVILVCGKDDGLKFPAATHKPDAGMRVTRLLVTMGRVILMPTACLEQGCGAELSLTHVTTEQSECRADELLWKGSALECVHVALAVWAGGVVAGVSSWQVCQ